MTPKRLKIWRRLAAFLSNLQEKELEHMLNTLLTFEEREMVINRIQIIEALLKGEKTQREIASSLQISISKITRGANVLKACPNDVKKLLEKY